MDPAVRDTLLWEFEFNLRDDHPSMWSLSDITIRLAHPETLDVLFERFSEKHLIGLMRVFRPWKELPRDAEIVDSNAHAARLLPLQEAWFLVFDRLVVLAAQRPELVAKAQAPYPPSKESVAVHLCEEEGWSPEAAAAHLGVSEWRMGRWLARAKRRRERQRS